MVPAYFLSPAEIRLIKRMLLLRPKPTNQMILAYFTRPGRDLNHRIIAEIDSGSRGALEPPATEGEILAYMAAVANLRFPDGRDFTPQGQFYAPGGAIGQLRLHWWPVGQGLFSSGALTLSGRRPLTWVFDCGTVSGSSLLDAALDGFESSQHAISSREIAIAAISHFDRDHINGFVRLLAAHRVRMLLFPYVPLWQRILVMLQQNISASDPLAEFFIDPTGFLASRGQVGEIIYVQSNGDDLPSPPSPVPFEPSGSPPEDDPLDVDDGKPPEAAEHDPARASKTVSVRFLRRGGSIRTAFWEFVPYNDTKLLTVPSATLQAKVLPGARRLLRASSDGARDAALASLGGIYDTTFGKGPGPRNRISLFLYSGPLDQRIRLETISSSHPVGLREETTRFSQMYTGDARLKTKREWNEFGRFFQPGQRLANSAILQIMHHGSKGNWQSGIASALAPSVSLFCSDPGSRPFHPHAEVLREFWPHFPVQVDTRTGFHLSARLRL